MTYQLTTLSNGLRVASETLPGLESVALSLGVGVGARNEEENENGISHLLEHMAFKGTKTRTARDIAEAFDAIGGQANAYTSMEMTVYHTKVLKNDIGLAADILGDIMQNSLFDAEELSREQGVICQEIAMHQDSPDDLISDYFDAAAFPAQPLGRSILSTEARINSYRRDDLIRYMGSHYRTGRMVLTAAGNIKHAQLVELAEKYFSKLPQGNSPAYAPAHYEGGDVRIVGDFEQTHLMLGLPAVPITSPDYYALQVYASILGGGMSSRLFQEVREKRGLAYTVYAMGSVYEDCGMLGIYAAGAPEKAGELSGVLCDEILRMGHSVGEEELARSRNQFKAELLMSRENPQSVASWIGRHLMVFGEYRRINEVMKRIDAVTIADIERLSQQLLRGRLTFAALGDVSHLLPYEKLIARLT